MKSLTLAALLMAANTLFAANTSRSKAQITDSTVVNIAEDLHISGDTPFSSTGRVNITNADAWVFFDKKKPSEVVGNYLQNVYINSEKATNGTNCLVKIYNSGSVIVPHGNSFTPLTVYSEKNYEGNSVSSYKVGNAYSSLGSMNNAIKSFKLKRGYMVTFFNGADGSGYNRIYIADKEDLEIPELPATLKGKISRIRILNWHYTSKRGYAGGDQTANALLNTTWFYGWDAGNSTQTDREYVPQHHHEGWPSISECTAHSDGTAILGNNEPDNVNDSREKVSSVSEVLANWPEMMKGGQRLGSPAMSSNLNGWLYPFIDSIDAKGYRCDYVALHCYWNSSPSSFMSSLESIYKRVKRPLWITEFNYGANWTTETWPNSDRSGTSANYERERAWMAELIDKLEACPYVERYSIYNWVQDCRKVYNTDDSSLKSSNYLTPAGKAYANANSNLAYNSNYYVIPKAAYYSPVITKSEFVASNQSVNLGWSDKNGELADSIVIERKLNDGDFMPLTRITPSQTSTTYTYKDNTITQRGTYTYRIVSYCADGKSHLSQTASVSVSGSDGKKGFQYGTIESANSSDSYSFYSEPFDAAPAVIIGAPTYNNKATSFVPTCNVYNTTVNYLRFRIQPMASSTTSQTTTESAPFIAMDKGNGTIGTLQYEMGNTASRVKGDTVQVTFNVPFADGVVPAVFGQIVSMQDYPFFYKIWDVTNLGFKVKLMREEATNKKYGTTIPGQTFNYFAIEPGKAELENGKTIEVCGRHTSTISSLKRKVSFSGIKSNPLFFMAPVTYNVDAATAYRSYITGDSCAWVARQVDLSTTIKNTDKADAYCWMLMYNTPEGSTSISSTDIAAELTIKGNRSSLEISEANATFAEIYSISGICLARKAMHDGKVTINLNDIPSGSYIIRTDRGHAKNIVIQ